MLDVSMTARCVEATSLMTSEITLKTYLDANPLLPKVFEVDMVDCSKLTRSSRSCPIAGVSSSRRWRVIQHTKV